MSTFKTAQNYFTGTEYKGGNALTLSLTKFKENQWATYKQWFSNGYQVQKGEHGTSILVVKDEPDSKKVAVRYYKVFNIAQVKEITDEE